LFFAAVAGDVDVLDALVDDLRAAARQVVDDAADRLLVAGDRPRRDDDGVVFVDLHETVIVDRHARQRRRRLALRARAEDEHVLRRITGHVGIANLYTRRDAQVAEPLRDLGVVD